MKAAVVPTVYVIDDDGGMRQAIQDLVESVGLRAEAFGTGEEFLKRPRTADPSCLVLDVRLPQMSGVEFQHKLAELGRACSYNLYHPRMGIFQCPSGPLKSGAVEFFDQAVFAIRIYWMPFSRRFNKTEPHVNNWRTSMTCKSAIVR